MRYEARFSCCGICTLMKKLGLYDLTPALCHLDYTMSDAAAQAALCANTHWPRAAHTATAAIKEKPANKPDQQRTPSQFACKGVFIQLGSFAPWRSGLSIGR